MTELTNILFSEVNVILSILLISSCATYSPEQLRAKASDKSDIDLCFDMTLANPSLYSKQELMNREVNCNDYAVEVIEKRKKQIQQAQMLYAFGNAMKGDPVISNISSVGVNTLPNYSTSSSNTTAPPKLLSSSKLLGDGRVECTYGVGITATIITKYGVVCDMQLNQ